ncbi:MAG: hypothetical protein HKN67_05090 [Saprospiraceae bacterium]|nr:hypothetical protein [Saprospiraceae bacterium]
MEANKLTEKEKTKNFISGFLTAVIAYIFSKIVSNYFGIEYKLGDAINTYHIIELFIFFVCFTIVKLVIDRFWKKNNE